MNALASPQALVITLAAAAAAAWFYASQQPAQPTYAGGADVFGGGSDADASAAPSLIGQLVQGYFTKGLRDNNPGNIRAGQGFVGEVSADGGFAVFDSMAHGCRALCRVLDNYRDAHSLFTVQDIIARYAPPSENDTASYVADVCQRLSVAAGDPLDTRDPNVMAQLIGAITHHENGYNPIPTDTILQGISLARTGG